MRVADVASKRLVWVTNDLFQDLNPVWSPSGRSIFFSSSRTGGLNIWRMPVRPDGTPSGPPQQLTTGAGQDVEIAVAKDGRKLAFTILKQNADLWKLPVSPQTGAADRRAGRSPRHDARGQPRRLVSRRRADRLQLGPRRRHEHLDLHGRRTVRRAR